MRGLYGYGTLLRCVGPRLRPDEIIVVNNASTDQTAAVMALAETLRAQITVPLVLQDERLSSREAESLLARRYKNWRDRKPLLDAASAAVILQDFLDTRRGSSQESGDALFEDDFS